MFRIYDKLAKDYLTIAVLFDARYWEYDTAEEAHSHLHQTTQDIDFSNYEVVEFPGQDKWDTKLKK